MGPPVSSHQLDTTQGRTLTILEYTTQDQDSEIKVSRGIILFVPAMAVKQHFYRRYAQYLADHSYRVFTMDFSGIGESKVEDLAGSGVTINTWIYQLEEVVEWMIEQFNPRYELPMYYISHSLGGQIFGLLNSNNEFKTAISITSQNGYWRYYKNKLPYFFFWYLIVPVVTRLFGYFPSSSFGLGEKLPKRVMLKWKKWCTSENYFFDDPSTPQLENYHRYEGPLLALSFSDDPWATYEAVQSLHLHYTQADFTHRHIDPLEFGMDEIGHLGFFREGSEELWDLTLNWLERHGGGK